MGHWRKTLISFLLTNQCNMECCYCSVGEKPKVRKILDLEFAKLAMDDYFQEDNRASGIRFFANGEPTLEIDIMDNITRHAFENYGRNINVEVQTNGFFDKIVLDWLKNNATIVWFSFDGLPEYHDKYRKTYAKENTSDRIINNIKNLINHTNVGCRMTLTDETVRLQSEVLKFMNSIGVKYVCSDPLYDIVEPGNHELPKKPSFMKFAMEYLKSLKTAEKFGITYLSFLNINFDEKVKVHCRACLPTPHVLNDGYISCCDMAYSYNPVHMRDLIYGRYIYEENRIEYDRDKIKAIKERNIHNLRNCGDCEVLEHCAGGCIGESLNETGSFNGIRKEYCEAVRYLARKLPLNCGLYPFTHP